MAGPCLSPHRSAEHPQPPTPLPKIGARRSSGRSIDDQVSTARPKSWKENIRDELQLRLGIMAVAHGSSLHSALAKRGNDEKS